MQVSYAPAFLRLVRKLDKSVKETVKETVGDVIDFYASRQRSPGLGIKRLRGELWEA